MVGKRGRTSRCETIPPPREDDPEKELQAAKTTHPHSQLTIKTPNASGYRAFLDLEINIVKDRRVSCGW